MPRKRLLRSLSSIKNSFSKPINQSRKGLQPFRFFEVKTTHKESFYEQSNSVEHRLDFFTKEGHDEPVTLPHTWNAVDGQDGGNDYYRGTCSYTRNLEKPELSDGDRAVLQFDGVAMTAVVSLNGEK